MENNIWVENNIWWKTCISVMIFFIIAIFLHYYACKDNFYKLNTKIDDGFEQLNTKFDNLKEFLEEPIDTNFKINP